MLLSGDCDIALAGGVSIGFPQRVPYRHEPALIYSPDGRTRPYDVHGDGTNMTNGAGVVVLKRLQDAAADGDDVIAVIVGSAVNNDGTRKVGYAAPSIDGQVEVMIDALDDAGLAAADIDYMEGHGTATPLGDAIELAAIAEVYGTDRVDPLVLGSIKGNVGHLNRAAGVTGLIKTAYAVRAHLVPATVHHSEPLPEVAAGCIHVPTSSTPLPDGRPVRAAVSSLGIGGTNAHVILESAPPRQRPTPATRGRRLPVVVSAATSHALTRRLVDLSGWLRAHPDVALCDVAHTLATRREALAYRCAIAAGSVDECIVQLEAAARRVVSVAAPSRVPAFMFPGGGTDVAGSLATIEEFGVVNAVVDRAATALAAAGGHDLRAHLVDGVVPGGAATNAATVTHPAIVAHGVAMAAALRELGIEPGGLIGYSLGQYTAAVVAGVLALEDAIRVVHARARLMDDIAPIGAMSSVLAAEADIAPLIPWPAAIGIRNGPNASVVSGPIDAVELFERRLDERGLPYRRIDVPNPNHTPNMLPMKDLLHEAFAGTVMHPPTIPIVSNVSGSLGGADITDVATWTRHIMEPVRFAEGLDSLVTIGCDLFVDLSDRGVLAGFASMTLGSKPTVAVAGLESPAGTARLDGLLAGVIRLWAAGATVRLGALAAGAPVHLPAYPFGGRHFTLTPTVRPRDSEPMALAVLPEAEWTSTLRWSRTRLPVPLDAGDPVPERIAVIGEGADADGFRRRCARHNIEIDDALATTPIATRAGGAPAIVVDFRPSTVNDPGVDPVAAVARLNAAIIDTVRGFGTTPVEYWMIARNAVATERAELIDPANASLVSLRRVVEQERASVRTCTLVDLPPNGGGDDNPDERAGRLLAEIVGPDDERVLAWRGPRRLVPAVTPHRDGGTRTVPTDGVVVITGGFGAVGRVVSAHLARRGFDLLVVSRRDPSGSPEAVTLMTDIEAYGRRIDYVQGDVADPATVARAFNRADRMGTVRGLLHLAAHVDAATHGHLSLLDNTMEADLERFAHAKVRGCAALTALTAQRHLDFRVLFSSISTELGGLGYAPYAAANRAAAAVAHNATAAGVPWHVIDWDVWGDDLPATETVAGGTAVPMPSAAATSVLECLLASEPQRFIVSTTDFAARARATARLSRDERVAPAPRRDHDVEAFVEQLWAEALGVVAPPGDRSFLALGGDSLTAIRVVIQLNGALDLTLSPGDMMRAPTLRDFVAVVRAAVALPVTDRVETGGDPGKTSMLQERWFDMWQRGFGDLEVCVALHGPVNETRLQEALEGVVARHRVLSLAYDRIDGELVGCPAPLAACELVDLDSVDRDDQAAAARRAMDRIRASRVCLTREAPFRPTLFHFCEELSVLTIQTHHIAMDGWSASLLVDDLVAIYDGSQQKPAPDYAAFALRQREYLTGAGIDDDRRYWRRMFEGAPGPSRIPPLDDVAGRDEGDTTAVKVVSDLGPLWGRLRDRAAKLGVTPFTLLMGAYALVVSAAIDSDDIVLGTTAAGRGASGEDETVGVFVNPLPVRIRIDAEASIDAYVAAVSEVLIGFHEHQRYLLADLVREVPPFVGLDINETFHTYILMQNFPKPTNASSLQPEIIETDNDHPRSVLDAFTHKKASLMRDLELIMFERDGSLTCNFWYRAGRYPRATVEGWSERFSAAVAALVDTPPFVGAVGDIQNAAPCPPEGGVED
jgi:acyl transferase domain-containing protein/NADP-dependent 3-hydroxy acid dehydrogenase YdfG